MTLRWTDSIWKIKPTWPTDLYEVGSKHLFYSWHPPDERYCIGYFYGVGTKYGTNEETIHHELHFWFFSFNFVYTPQLR